MLTALFRGVQIAGIFGMKVKSKKAPFPASVKPMLATLTKDLVQSPDWIFEVKWDGYRVIAEVQKGKVKLLSRSGQNFTKNYPPVVDALAGLKHDAIIDGEIVLIDASGKPSFDELQRYNGSLPIIYYAFDLIWLNGKDLTGLTLLERKEMLAEILPEDDTLKFSDHFEDGVALFEQMQALEMEGMIAKKKNSFYRPGIRTNDWLKIQTSKRQEFVVGGWTESTSGRVFRSLLFGWYHEGKLHYVGHAGHGFKEAETPKILDRLKKMEIKKSPFVNEVDASTAVHFVKPELVIEVKFATFTRSGKIRKPAIFLGFRKDKKPTEVTKQMEVVKGAEEGRTADDRRRTTDDRLSNKRVSKPFQSTMEDSNWPVLEKQRISSQEVFDIEGNRVTINNVEKKLWEGVTKADLIQYYHFVSSLLLPHLRDRPLSLHIKHIRPDAPGMYIKDMEGRQPEWADIFSIERKHKKKGKRDAIDYLVCNNLSTLLYVINLNCIDINPWTSRTSDYFHPDFVVIDLDPSDDDFRKAIEAALAAKEIFDKYKLKVFPKTSGKTGIHLFIPCRGFTFSEARNIAENICDLIHQDLPDITTTNVEIDSRGNKLYLDPNQNDEADTVASVYSVRPFHVPNVSTPLDWKEINSKLDPGDFNIHSIGKRLKKKGDVFKGVLEEGVALKNSKILKGFL